MSIANIAKIEVENIMGSQKKSDRIASDRKALAGVQKHILKSIVMGGETYSPKDFSKSIESMMEANDQVDALRLQLAAAVKVANTATADATEMIALLKKYLVGHFGESSAVLADFGFAPRKVAQRTVVQKYQAVEKTLATRAARHTMGSRQRDAIHGTIPTASPQPPAVQPVSAQPATTNGVTNGAAQPAVLSLNGLNGAAH